MHPLSARLAFFYRCGGDSFLAPWEEEPAFEAVFNPQNKLQLHVRHPPASRALGAFVRKMCCLCSNASFLVLLFLRLENTEEGETKLLKLHKRL